jgi:hypothetical protein
VGNKADLNCKISKDHAITYSKLKKFQGFGECSALKNINIKETFVSFYKTLYKRNKGKLEEKLNKKIIQLKDMQKKHSNRKKDCC